MVINWEEYNKWKMCKYQSQPIENLDTFHSFDVVFDHIGKRFEDITRNVLGIPLKDVEIPQADPAWTRTNYKPKTLLDASFLPRAVYMYELNSSIEPIVDIPTMTRANRSIYGGNYACLTIEEKDIHNSSGEVYNYMKDISMSLVAKPRYGSYIGFWSILVNEKPLALEIMKNLKWKLPLNETQEFYYGKAVCKDEPYEGRIFPIPYTLESYIPNTIIERLLEIFQLDDTEDGKTELLYILKEHSKNRIEWKYNSGKGESRFALAYPSPVYITPNSIDLVESENNNIRYYGVKLEFKVDYMEFSQFFLSTNLMLINKNNPALEKEFGIRIIGDHSIEADGLIHEAVFSERIMSTTVWDTYEVEIGKEDLKYMVEEGKGKYNVVINVLDLINDFRLQRYLKELLRNRCSMNLENYINVEVKRTKLEFKEENLPGMDHDITFDHSTLDIVDTYTKVGNRLFIAIYLNKKHFSRWLWKNGYEHTPNLSSYGE